MSFKNYKPVFIICLLIIALWACSDEFNVDTNVNKKLAVSCVVKSGNPIVLVLSCNAPLNSFMSGISFDESTKIEGAIITVYQNNQLIDTMTYSCSSYCCFYKTKQIATAGSTYKIVITHNLYPQATTTVSVPIPVNIDSVKYKVFADSLNMLLKVFFTDKNYAPDYYQLNFYESKKQYQNFIEFYNTDPVFGNELKYDFESFDFTTDIDAQYKVDIPDTIYNTRAICYQCVIPFNTGIIGGGNTIAFADTLGIILNSVSQPIFEYNRSLANYIDKQNSGLPSQLYTNIENGLGVAGGYSQTIYKFVIK